MKTFIGIVIKKFDGRVTGFFPDYVITLFANKRQYDVYQSTNKKNLKKLKVGQQVKFKFSELYPDEVTIL